MGGLFDTFWRHFVILTKFPKNEVKSRPYWPGGGYGTPGRTPRPPTPALLLRASGARFAVWGCSQMGSLGVLCSRRVLVPAKRAPEAPTGLEWVGTSARTYRGMVLGGYRYSPPDTHPVYPPRIPTLVHPASTSASPSPVPPTGWVTTGACTYDRFEDP